MNITASGSVPTRRGAADSFTGIVWQDPIIDAPAPARIRATRVSFEPRARTAWHTHPLGQTLHVLSGVGRVQAWGGPVREIRPGDTVAVGAGSRGIANIGTIVGATVKYLRDLGARPFVFPAMGSHGGGTAEGQRRTPRSARKRRVA